MLRLFLLNPQHRKIVGNDPFREMVLGQDNVNKTLAFLRKNGIQHSFSLSFCLLLFYFSLGVNYRNDSGETALMVAVVAEQKTLVQKILATKGKPNDG